MANGGAYDFSRLHPGVAAWFKSRYGEPTPVQRQAWAAIQAGAHTLIASPTGSGKTLAALLPCLDQLLRDREESGEPAEGSSGEGSGSSARGVRILYVTPLRALNNDIQHHLLEYIEQLRDIFIGEGRIWPDIRTAVRTGDTPASTRASMLRRPPDILVTTPESLYLLLTSEKGSRMLSGVRQVIVDEIHELAPDKRGAHLSLSLERLEALCGEPVQRIGVSATQKPLERAARYLGGWMEPAAAEPGPGAAPADSDALLPELVPRPVSIVESAMDKRMELRVTMPDYPSSSGGKADVWLPLCRRVTELMEGSATTLVFVNNRRLCERLTLHLNDYTGKETARSHHGSLSREARLEAERQLKAGELDCLVATSSMELGIDVGRVDLVIQVDSPREAAAGIQRVGRAGHSVQGVSRGVIVARGRGELAEIAVLARRMAARDIEELRIPRNRLDVLAQQVTAMVAVGNWNVRQLYRVIRRSDGYRELPMASLLDVLKALSGYYPFIKPVLDWSRESGELRRRSNTPMAALMGAGTIPSSSAYPVYHADSRIHLGELDEVYIHESRAGDRFQLGSQSWTIQSIRQDRVYVRESGSFFSEIPFWLGETVGRPLAVGAETGALLRTLAVQLGQDRPDAGEAARSWLKQQCAFDDRSADALAALVESQLQAGFVPSDRLIAVEHYRDQADYHHVVIHSLFGRVFNRTWALALEQLFRRTVGAELDFSAKDGGIEIVGETWEPAWARLLTSVDGGELEPLLGKALTGSAMLGAAFRSMAETALLLPRGFKRVPAWVRRERSERLLRELLPYAEETPFIREAMRDCLEERLDLPGVRSKLEAVRLGEIGVVYRERLYPSPFAALFTAEYLNRKMYESDAFSKELQQQLAALGGLLPEAISGQGLSVHVPDPEMVEEEKRRLRAVDPPAGGSRSLDEWLRRVLKEKGDRSEQELAELAELAEQTEPYSGGFGDRLAEALSRLEADGLAARLEIAGEARWISRDEQEVYETMAERDSSLSFVLVRCRETALSFSVSGLCRRYGLAPEPVRRLIGHWRQAGDMVPCPVPEAGEREQPVLEEEAGGIPPAGPDRALWTSRRIAARLVRRSMGRLRERLGACEPEAYCGYLLKLQHAAPDARLSGQDGLRDVLSSLQGVFAPPSIWEQVILPVRLADYRKEQLDLLCSSGEIVWIGRREEGEQEGKVAFFLAESADLLAPYVNRTGDTAHPRLLELLQDRGAAFLSALSRDWGQLPSDTLKALLDLAWEGRVSNDQFAPLRLRASAGKAAGKGAAFRSGLGRWYVLDTILPSGKAPPLLESAAGWARHLLDGYGLITRDLVRGRTPLSWETMEPVLKQMEEWGSVTRGLFVKGVSYQQFSSSEQLQRLREAPGNGAPSFGGGDLTVLSAADPANPYGFLLPWPEWEGPAFSRKPVHYMALAGGKPVWWLENRGRRLYVSPEYRFSSADSPLPVQALRRAFRSLLDQGMRKVVVDSCNGLPAASSPEAEWLAAAGGEMERSACVIWPSSLR